MKNIILVFCLIMLYLTAFSQEAEVAQEKDVLADGKDGENFKFGVRFGIQTSFFDFGENGFFDVTEQNQLGGSFGFSLDWKITDFNRIRVEPYYMYQPLLNSYNEDGNMIEVKLKNHVPGIDFFPLVLTYGKKIKGTISAGGFYRYKILGSETVTINGEQSPHRVGTYSSSNYGYVIAGGVYLGRKLLEVRVYKSLIDSYTDMGFSNRVTDFSLLFVL